MLGNGCWQTTAPVDVASPYSQYILDPVLQRPVLLGSVHVAVSPLMVQHTSRSSIGALGPVQSQKRDHVCPIASVYGTPFASVYT
jgi:hypothetical protein